MITSETNPHLPSQKNHNLSRPKEVPVQKKKERIILSKLDILFAWQLFFNASVQHTRFPLKKISLSAKYITAFNNPA